MSDLARVALQVARVAAKTRPDGAAAARRVVPWLCTGGRDPIMFTAVIDNLVTEWAWQAGAGSVIDRWAAIAPRVGRARPSRRLRR
ncbi:hypothetical protein AB0A91_34795 [Streptomyces sp. NPDC042207]|uniref:hypothetical protein n=1 Tax=Streptomyces sp. NPDC042207 TaxID=3154331 RepID=UPI0034051EDF